MVAASLSGNDAAHINKVTLRRARLVYSTEVGDRVRVQFPVRDIYLGMWPTTQVNIQPSHPFVGRYNEY